MWEPQSASAPINTVNASSPDFNSGITFDPDNPPWGVAQGILTWLMSVGLLVFLPLVTIIPYLAYRMATQGSLEGLGTDVNLIFFSLIGALPAHIVTFFIVWAVVSNRGRRPFWEALGWSWPQNFGAGKSIFLAILLLGVGWLITWLLGGAETQLDEIIKSSLKARVATAFLAAVTGPLVEELVYRGVLYSALQKAAGVAPAVVIVSILFAAVHVAQYYNNIGVILVITMLSVALTLVRALTRKLLPAYIMHLSFNGVQAVLLLLEPFLQRHSGAEQNAAAVLLSTLATIF